MTTYLLEQNQLSVKYIRSLNCEKVHDHVYGWQSDCEQWLREHQILPNEGTKQFIGLERIGEYNAIIGLPPLSSEKQQQREKQLRDWIKNIQQLQVEAEEYPKYQDF